MLLRGFLLLLAPCFHQLTVGSTALGIGFAQAQPGLRGVDAIITFDPRVVPEAAVTIVARQRAFGAVPTVEREIPLHGKDRLVGLLHHRDLDPVLDHRSGVAIVVVDPPSERGVQALQEARELHDRRDTDEKMLMVAHEGAIQKLDIVLLFVLRYQLQVKLFEVIVLEEVLLIMVGTLPVHVQQRAVRALEMPRYPCVHERWIEQDQCQADDTSIVLNF